MAREKESYRDNLERIKAKYPDKEMLRICEVSEFLGIHRKTLKKMFTFNDRNYISVASLARQMS